MQVLRLLSDVSAKYGTTVIIITHNTLIASMAKRVIRMKNGRIESVVLNKDPMPVEEIAW